MKLIVLASHNPVKTQAALNGFRRMFPGEQYTLQKVAVASEVRNQPLSSDEALQGAHYRARPVRAGSHSGAGAIQKPGIIFLSPQ